MAMASVLSARPLGINAVRTVARSSTAKPARAASFVVKAERELWYPGATAPEYLDGSMAGDFGEQARARTRRGELLASNYFMVSA